jgi:hypothetical protein
MAGQYPENLNGEQFIDSCIPEDGWEIGTYEVLIYLDDEIAGTYPFTIE